MYHNTLLTKDHPEQVSLEKAIEIIITFSEVNSIYFSPHIEDDLNCGIIIVIIGEDSPHTWDRVNGIFRKVFEKFPQFSFRLFSAQWVKDELTHGNPFFAMHCTKNSLIYSTTDSEELDFVERLKPRRFLNMAKNRFEAEVQVAFVLGVNLNHYKRGEDHLQAAYNIHQNIRSLLIAAEFFVTGEWLVDQDLEVHHRHLGSFSMQLAAVFDINMEGEIQLLKLLNASCDSVQNGEKSPEFSAEIIEVAEAKKELIRTEVSRLFDECICRCRYEFSRTKIPLIALDQNDPIKLITQIIIEAVDTVAIYRFGQSDFTKTSRTILIDGGAIDFQNTHYYLFLIVDHYEPHVAGNISFNIKSQTRGRYSATLVMHTKKSLYQKQGDQLHFFYEVLQRGQLLYQKTAKPTFLSLEEIPTRNIKSAKMYLHQRNRTAEFLQEAEALDGGGATKIHVYFMHLVVEQTCLGLIRLFLGYMPNHFSLVFLFELCEYFTPLTAELFPRQTEKDRELLKILSGHNTSLRYGFIDDVPHHDYEVLSNRYNEFVERAGKLAETELERLEQIKETNNQNN